MNSYCQNVASLNSLNQSQVHQFSKTKNPVRSPLTDENALSFQPSNSLQNQSQIERPDESKIVKILASRPNENSKGNKREERNWLRRKQQYIKGTKMRKFGDRDQSLEKITKKLKTISKSNIARSQDDNAVNNTPYEDYGKTHKDGEILIKRGDSITDISEEQSIIESDRNTENIQNNLKTCKNVVVSYDHRIKELVFTIQYIDTITKESKEMFLTRKQMVEFDPRSVLYFYENHLDFPQDTGFQGKLKRV